MGNKKTILRTLTARTITETGEAGPPALQSQKTGFPVQSGGISGQAAGRADDTVTGNDQRDGIVSHGASDGTG